LTGPPTRAYRALAKLWATSCPSRRSPASSVGHQPHAGSSPAARRHIGQDKTARFRVDHDREKAVAKRFLAACETGDLDSLISVLDPEVVLQADGGGKVQAPRRPISGRETVVKVFANGLRRFPGLRTSPATVNGGPGILIHDANGTLITVAALTIYAGHVQQIDLIGNPDKLARIQQRLA